MEETRVGEKPPVKESPSQSAYYRMQEVLKQQGKLTTRTIEGGMKAKFLNWSREVKLPLSQSKSFLIVQRHDVPEVTPDITIYLVDTDDEDLKTQLQAKKIKWSAQITLRNPPRVREEKAFIVHSSRAVGLEIPILFDLFQLSQSQWQKVDEEDITKSEKEAEKIVDTLIKGEFLWPQTPPFPLKNPLKGKELKKDGGITEGPHIARRRFLKLIGIGSTAAALDSLLAHIPFLPSLSKSFWEQLETATIGVPEEQLKKEIEDKFHIEIVSPSTGVKEVEYDNKKKYPTVEWDSPRLKGLIGALLELPPHFYLPRKFDNEERKVRFALTNVPDWEWWLAGKDRERRGFCACGAAENQLIVYDKSGLGQTFLESGSTRKNWFHEITHALTNSEIDEYVDSIVKPIGIEELPQLRKNFASEVKMKSKGKNLFPRIHEAGVSFNFTEIPTQSWQEGPSGILTRKNPLEGETYDRELLVSMGDPDHLVRVAPGWYVYKNHFEKKGKEYFEEQYSKFLEREKDWEEFGGEVDDKSSIGYGARNFGEFFSVAAEYYSKGRIEFVKTYEPFLGKERAGKLYEGMKQEIFRGREY